MTDRITIFGYGPVGSATAARLLSEGREVIVAQRDRPYQVDASRFKATFWSDVTPFETGVPETARAFRAESKRAR
jgi:predicted dinucleotide-binding enzyme